MRWLTRVTRHAVLLILVTVWLAPTAGLLVTSFRPPARIQDSGWWNAWQTPRAFNLANYRQVLTRQGLARAFANSLLICGPATLLSTAVAAMAAYGFAWLRFPGRRWLLALIVALMVIPLQMTFIPILPVYRRLGLAGTFPGIWLAHAGYGLPLTTFLLYTFIAALPRDLMEAAAVDGASAWQTFTRIVLPVSVPALASVTIFQFLWIWNDLLVALIYLGATPDVAPVTLAVANLVTNRGQNWELLTAAAFVAMLLPLVVFFSLQRYFVKGILAGSVKS